MFILSDKHYLEDNLPTKEILVFSSVYVQKIYQLQGRTRDIYPTHKLQAYFDNRNQWRARILCGLSNENLWTSSDAIIYHTPDEALGVAICALKKLFFNLAL